MTTTETETRDPVDAPGWLARYVARDLRAMAREQLAVASEAQATNCASLAAGTMRAHADQFKRLAEKLENGGCTCDYDQHSCRVHGELAVHGAA